MSLLDCRQLTLRAGNRLLIDALDWRVGRGEVWCVLGPNGVGKSTLLYTVAGLLQPAAGAVLLDSKPLGSWSLDALARTRGLMAQQQVDAFSATALDAVLIGRTPHRLGSAAAGHGRGRLARVWDSQKDIDAARAALTTVGMQAFEAADVLKLSGGERQRVALATLLAQAPHLMLLDEPTSHQDVAQQVKIMRLIRDQASLHTMVVTTHDINLAQRFATHVLLLSAPAGVSGSESHGQRIGKNLQAGTITEVLTRDNLEHAFGCRFDLVDHLGERLFIAR